LIVAEFNDGDGGILRTDGRVAIRRNAHALNPSRTRCGGVTPEQVSAPQPEDKGNRDEEM
jgi:hypothetical protein